MIAHPAVRLLRFGLAVALLSGGCGTHGATPVTPGSPTVVESSAPVAPMVLASPAVVDGRFLPAFRCEPKIDGVEASIPLVWSNVPSRAVSLALAMTHHPDPADPSIVSSYLLVWGIPPTAPGIAAGAADDGPWFLGANKDGVSVSYTSPCSKGSGTHTYTITLYALARTPSSLPARSTLDVTYPVLMAALATAPIVSTAELTFTDLTP